MTTFSENVKEFGLYNFVAMEMRRKRESYQTQQGGKWYGKPMTRMPKGAGKVWLDVASGPVAQPEKQGKLPVAQHPVKKIIPLGISSVDERDEQLEELLQPDMPTELSLVSRGPVAGEDDIEEAQDEEIAEKAASEVDVECE